MEMKTILRNGTLINEGKKFVADILIANGRIEKIASSISDANAEIIDAKGAFTPATQAEFSVDRMEQRFCGRGCNPL